MSEIFELEIYCKSTSGISTTLKLPATPFELADAFEKLRITDGKTPFQNEIVWCEPEYLSEIIDEMANIYELNLLSQRIHGMSQWELDCFDGLVRMEQEKNNPTTIPVEKLINLAYSLENCQIAYEAHNDKQLGKFYVDNGMSDIPDNLPEVVYEMLDYESIGRKARTSEGAESLCGGVFTDRGYVVQNGAIAQVYQRGSASVQATSTAQSSKHTIVLEVCKGLFSEGGHIESPLLPADDGMIHRVLGQLEATSVEECSFRAVDCIVPKLTKLISDSLYASEGDCYGAVNELASQLQRLNEAGKLNTYRAMMEAVPDDLTLENAIDLSQQIEYFSLIPEVTSPHDYALHQLNRYQIEHADDLYRGANLYNYGKNLMKDKGVQLTEYGLLWTTNLQPVQEMLRPDSQNSSMEMR